MEPVPAVEAPRHPSSTVGRRARADAAPIDHHRGAGSTNGRHCGGAARDLSMTPTAGGQLAWVEGELDDMQAAGLERRLLELDGPPGPTVELDGRTYILLGSNNYLDLAAHPAVVQGAIAAARRFGAGAGASRLLSGATPLQRELERGLAGLLRAQDALLFSSGYLANVATVAALVGKGDEVFSDALNHASIIDGCRLSGARVTVYPHRDVDCLAQLLRSSTARRRLVVSDTVFSMEGSVAPVNELATLAGGADAMLLLDESHALGVMGTDGAGLAAEIDFEGKIVMATLSKALGSAGGVIAGSAMLIRFLQHRARGFVFDTAPGPPAVGAARAALEVMLAEPGRRQILLQLTARLRNRLRAGDLRVPEGETAIVPLLVATPEASL